MKPTEFKTKIAAMESVLNLFEENSDATGSKYTEDNGFSKLLDGKGEKEIRAYHFFVHRIFTNANKALVFTDANDNKFTLINPPDQHKQKCKDILKYFGLDFEMSINYVW